MATETTASKLHVKAGPGAAETTPTAEVPERESEPRERVDDLRATEESRLEPLLQALSPELTLLAESDSIQGRMVISGDGRLLGIFSGDVECSGELLVGPLAEVTATIRGRHVTIAGNVRGNVVCQGRLKIASTGRLEGDARVGALVVDEGGVHHGVIRVHPEGVPEEPEAGPAENSSVAVEAAPPTPVDRVRKFWGEFF